TLLSDFLDDEGQRLIFVFDYLTDRSFFMELKKTQPGRSLKDPVCSLALGNPPAQFVNLDEFEARIDEKVDKAAADPDLDESFYGSDEYNDDEFDAAGFDEVNPYE
ncbi:MAG: hypothetical protein K2H99_01215, partial [Paramuribaculum sp.]|nr:hypothetical protein [Paramuribaculum sp.]